MIKNDHVLHAGLTPIIIQHALVTSLYNDFYNSLLHTFFIFTNGLFCITQ